LIFLDCRENTFCVPMHCGSSMLAGVAASAVLTLFFNQAAPSGAQLASAGLIIVALLFLSPLHHFQRTVGRVRRWLAGLWRPFAGEGVRPLTAADAAVARRAANDLESLDKLRRLFLFVCSGNTCRSPMAAAIGNAEIAARLKIPFDDLHTAHARALSAGVSAKVGAPMTSEAQQALGLLDVPARPHAARNLTAELAHQVEMIFCMTRAHREAVIEMVPSAAGKTHCLDPGSDIEDPLGGDLEAYMKCAGRIRSLISWRLDEARLTAPA
jgi:protein-tyrosine-phosphatase